MGKIVKQVSVELAYLHSWDPEEHKPPGGGEDQGSLGLCPGQPLWNRPCWWWLCALILCAPCLRLFLALPRTTRSLFTENGSAFGICLRLSWFGSPNAQIIRYLEKERWLKTRNIKSPSPEQVHSSDMQRGISLLWNSRTQ